MKKIVILLYIIILLIPSSFAYWASDITGNFDTATGNVLIGNWAMPLDVDYEYDPGDLFTYNDQVWEVVDINEPVEPGETRMLVIIPGEGLVLVAITGDGNGNTIVVRID